MTGDAEIRLWPEAFAAHNGQVMMPGDAREAVWTWGYYPLVGHEHEGVRRYDRESGEWTFRRTDGGYLHGADILEASEQYLWFGESGTGRDTGQWVNFSVETGKENKPCRGSGVGGGMLWLRTGMHKIVRWPLDDLAERLSAGSG